MNHSKLPFELLFTKTSMLVSFSHNHIKQTLNRKAHLNRRAFSRKAHLTFVTFNPLGPGFTQFLQNFAIL